VHELDTERLAVGPSQDRDDLPERAEFEAQHTIEENPAIEIRIGEAIGPRIELLGVLRGFEAKGIEVGMQMAAHAEGADEHQRLDRIACGLMNVLLGDLDAAVACPRADLGGDGLPCLTQFGHIEIGLGRDKVARRQRPVGALP
jgi:hypothetical protein